MAGESADEVARRQRAKAERLNRSAEAWEKGALGERQISDVLALLPPGWHVFHDRAWPRRARANIDHLVVGPGGIFVIDAKNWSGTVTTLDGELRQNGRRRDAAVEGVAAAALAISGVASVSSARVTPVICLAREDELAGRLGDVLLCSASNLFAMLTSRPVSLAAHEVERTAEALQRLAPAVTTARRPRRPVAGRRAGGRTRRRKRGVGRDLVALAGCIAMVVVLSSEAGRSSLEHLTQGFTQWLFSLGQADQSSRQ